MTSPLLSVEKLQIERDMEPFGCGKEELNRLLKRFALANQRAGTSQTYVTIAAGSRAMTTWSLWKKNLGLIFDLS